MARRDFNSARFGAELANSVYEQEQIRKKLEQSRRWAATDQLCIAAQNNERDLIPGLARRTNIDAFSNNGMTPLQAACSKTVEPETVQLLLNLGAGINARGRDGSTALHKAVTADNGAEGVRMLLDNGADPNVQNGPGATPLHVAAAAPNDPGCTQALLEAGANPNIADETGNTPLHVARSHSMDLLLDYGARHDAQNLGGETPLHLVAGRGEVSEAQTLINRGTDVNVRDLRGNTALHTAAAGSTTHPEIGDRLVRAGVDVHATNKDGRTAVQVADMLGNAPFKNAVQGAIVDCDRTTLTHAMEQDAPAQAPAPRWRMRL